MSCNIRHNQYVSAQLKLAIPSVAPSKQVITSLSDHSPEILQLD